MTDYKYSLLASSLSGLITKSSVAPFERLKLLKQSQIYYKTKNYSTIKKSFKYILNNEGIKGFYRGNLTNLTRVVPTYMLKFPLNEFYKSKIHCNSNNFNTLLLSGTLSGLTQICITYPLDFTRTRMSLDNSMTKNYNGIFRTMFNIIKTEGICSLYKGFSICGTTYPLYVGIQFSLYEQLKDDFNIFAGTMAGFVAQTLMFPGDTIKRQLQINGLDNTKSRYNNVFECIRFIYRNNGIRGFYNGLGINLLKVIPEATIQFEVYNYIMRNYGRNNKI